MTSIAYNARRHRAGYSLSRDSLRAPTLRGMASRRPRPSSLQEAFGLALRTTREAGGYSQEELGFRSKAHRTYISELERGLKSPSLEVIDRLARSLDTRASVLIGLAEEYLG